MTDLVPEHPPPTRITKDLRNLVDAFERYLTHMRTYLGMSRSDLLALRLIASCHSDKLLTPSELASQLGLSNAATTALLDRLTESGHVQRISAEDDRRLRPIQISAHAARLADDLFSPLEIRLLNVLSSLPDEHLAIIDDVFAQLIEAVKEASDEVGSSDFVLPESEDLLG